jgi:c-di-GMP-binding flagellar brake protein YcgR
MFKSIKQLFIRESNKHPVQTQKEEIDTDSNPRFLRKHEQISHLLQQLKDDNSLLTVFLEGCKETYATTILSINPKKNWLLFDELNQTDGHAKLLQKQKFKVQASHNGVDAIFTLDSLEVGQSKGIAFYKTALPQEIYYPQRRAARRLTLTSSRPVPFYATITTDNVPLLGHLQNISSTGIAALISGRLPCRRGDLLKHCRIPLPDGSEIKFDLVIRALNNQSLSQKVCLGGFFKNMDNSNHKKLERFIIKSEREQIKREKSGQ